ncbi:MAG: hypothetical protein JKY37_08345 [Nannocystaceae bacterium]|nr:hypothetical protein [Nannocystaceae bacterium]
MWSEEGACEERSIGEQEDPTDGTELVMKAEIERVLQSKDTLRHATEPPK